MSGILPWNKPVPRPSAALVGAQPSQRSPALVEAPPAIPRNGIAKRPR